MAETEAPPSETPSSEAQTPQPDAAPQQDSKVSEVSGDGATTGPAGKAKAATEKAKKALGQLKKLGIWDFAKEIARDLIDRDRTTRRMALYFVLSILGIGVVLVSGGVYVSGFRKGMTKGIASTGDQGRHFGQFIKKEADQAKLRYSTQSLGTFTIQLKTTEAEGLDPRPPGVMNLAQLEIIVQCDQIDTCGFIEDHMPAVRDQLTDILTAMDRDELLSKDGKLMLKKRIMSKLNYWLPQGKIKNIFFDKLVIS